MKYNHNKISRNINNSSPRDDEDLPILDALSSISGVNQLKMLEVGSGECRFVKKIQKLFPQIRITCVEINPQLAEIAKKLGCDVINKNILDIPTAGKYDVVHCSHVIEHFSYPDITKVLDYLVHSVKPNGFLFLRSPLLDRDDTWCFYGSIDHIKPYPPQSIINYFKLQQQQKKGEANFNIEKIWYRTSPKQFENISTWHLLYGIKILRKPINSFINVINKLFKKLWIRYRWPSTRPNGYVLILKILS